MKRIYDDLLAFTDKKPSFFQADGVPRWQDFTPGNSAGVYAHEAAIVEIACQSCDTRFHVLFERGNDPDAEISALIASGELAYGDPPNIGCCLSGASMTSENVRVIEYWRRERMEWIRDSQFEVAFRRFDDPWTPEMRHKAHQLLDDAWISESQREQIQSALAFDDKRVANPKVRHDPAYATDYKSAA